MGHRESVPSGNSIILSFLPQRAAGPILVGDLPTGVVRTSVFAAGRSVRWTGDRRKKRMENRIQKVT